MHDVLVIDTETGGLDPATNSILALGAVAWRDHQLLDEFEVLIREPEISSEDEAQAIHNIDVERLRANGVSPAQAVDKLENFIGRVFARGADQRVTVAGHNVAFDIGFLKRLYRLAGRSYEATFSHRALDTASILRFLTMAGKVHLGEVGSSEAFRYFGIVFADGTRHTALGDARATALLINKLLTFVGSQAAVGRSSECAACFPNEVGELNFEIHGPMITKGTAAWGPTEKARFGKSQNETLAAISSNPDCSALRSWLEAGVRLSLKVVFYLRADRVRRSDVDNLLNVLFNSLVEAACGPRPTAKTTPQLKDALFWECVATKVESPDERTLVSIARLAPE